MTVPKMIIFDYGHTLLYDPNWDTMRGNKAVLDCCGENNTSGVTQEEMRDASHMIFGAVEKIHDMYNVDLPAQRCHKVMDELLGISPSLTPVERELVFWDAASEGAIMPKADKLLRYLNEKEIRTAVISNLTWSSEALTERFNRLLPDNRFEFVMTSCDYIFRKPSRILFDIALKKAGLSANEVWYCGDNPDNDVVGAHEAGIFPVLYECADELKDDSFRHDKIEGFSPDFEYLKITDWDELILTLEKQRNGV